MLTSTNQSNMGIPIPIPRLLMASTCAYAINTITWIPEHLGIKANLVLSAPFLLAQIFSTIPRVKIIFCRYNAIFILHYDENLKGMSVVWLVAETDVTENTIEHLLLSWEYQNYFINKVTKNYSHAFIILYYTIIV